MSFSVLYSDRASETRGRAARVGVTLLSVSSIRTERVKLAADEVERVHLPLSVSSIRTERVKLRQQGERHLRSHLSVSSIRTERVKRQVFGQHAPIVQLSVSSIRTERVKLCVSERIRWSVRNFQCPLFGPSE